MYRFFKDDNSSSRLFKVIKSKLLETYKFISSNSVLNIFFYGHATITYEEYTRINSLIINN